jgi:KDO2-lipid IV(A) lauroyltransferase
MRHNSFKKNINHWVEYGGFFFISRLFKILGLKNASALAGILGKTIGPFLPATKTARNNLSHIFPDLSPTEIDQIIPEIWAHWAKVASEYCHLPHFFQDDLLEVHGTEVLEKLPCKKAIFFSAHLGHFQMIPLVLKKMGWPVLQLYRQANNPFVDQDMRRFQHQACSHVVSKSENAVFKMIQALKRQESVFVLVDQRFGPGPQIPFMGYPAYTLTTPAELSKRFQAPFIPVQVQRLHPTAEKPSWFRVIFYPPIGLESSAEEMMGQAHKMMESWITEQPEQWFWVHKRWLFEEVQSD